MSFFDEKEEVIDIELTQYGKYILGKGKFNPKYYSFFDDDILYDSDYASVSESQNSVEDRVKDVPIQKTQYIYYGAETEIKKLKEGVTKIIPTPQKSYSLSAPMGNSSILADKAPAWNIQYLKGELSSSVSYLTSSYQTLKIPQLSSSIEYIIEKGEKRLDASSDYNVHIFPDDSFVQINEDEIVLEIEEQNAPFEIENFYVEVFLCEQEEDKNISSNKRENLIPLSFIKRENELKDNLIWEEKKDKETSINIMELDPNYVEYYLDIQIDGEIEETKLCGIRGKEQKRSVFADKSIDCTEIRDSQSRDLFEKENDIYEECIDTEDGSG